MDAIGAASLPASDVPKIVEAQVTQALARRDAERAKADTAGKAKELVAMAIDGGYPREREAELLRAASDPALYATMEVAVRPYVDAARGRDPQLFDQLTFAGAPRGAGAGPRATASASGPDVKVVRNELATFVEIGGRFSKMACDMADSNDPATRAKIDAVLSDSERSHPGLRLIAANRILEKERPDLLETEQRSELQLMGLF
jgi:hypothetical protein